MDEAGEPEQDPIDEVAYNYLTTNFPFDFLALLPLGFVGSLIDHRLEILWIFKSTRINMLNVQFSDKAMLPIVDDFIEWR